jgi:protein-S-isoprenylcysteine O-methyltransferase Ste14
MMITIGNFLFHFRNGLFPLFYLLLFVPSPPLFADYRLAVALGLAVALLGQSLRAVTIGLDYIIRGGRKRQVYAQRLVSGGMFAHCRNPLYVGNFTTLFGVGIAANSLLFLALAIPFFAFAYWAIIAAEENYLRGKFGAEYDDYCARVNRLIPRFSGMAETFAGMRFNWRRLISAEYGSTYIWTAAIILVTFKNVWLLNGSAPDLAVAWPFGGALVLVTCLYLAARIAKKSGWLADRPAS